MSQRLLARMVDVAVGTIQNYEHGRATMTVARIEQIARALNVEPADLLAPPGSELPKLRLRQRRLLLPQRIDPPLWPLSVGFYARDLREVTIVELDRASLEACGLAPDAPSHLDWTLADWFKSIHSHDHAATQIELDRLRSRGAFATQYRLTGWDGVERSLVDCSRIIYDAAGRPMRVQGMLLDVTRARRTTAAEQVIARIIKAVRET